MDSTKVIPYAEAQKLFLKLCFIFKQVNFLIRIPASKNEVAELLIPKELEGAYDHVGTIQYGGVKYPILLDKDQIKFQYVELRLKGKFLKSISKYNEVLSHLNETNSNDWIKYKFSDSSDDIRLAERVRDVLINGFEMKYGVDYLGIGIDNVIFDLPRNGRQKRYNQEEAISIISDNLIKNRYEILNISTRNKVHHILVSRNNRKASIRVRHLQFDNAYEGSQIPYQVYKIDAFEKNEEHTRGIEEVDFIVGYNPTNDCFACLDIKQYYNKKSKVVHEVEGQNHQYFNSWVLLDNYFSKTN